MTSAAVVSATWNLSAIALSAGAVTVDDFWYSPFDDGTGTGTLHVVGVAQAALDAALAAWLEANPQ